VRLLPAANAFRPAHRLQHHNLSVSAANIVPIFALTPV